jgi:polyphosphate kinase
MQASKKTSSEPIKYYIHRDISWLSFNERVLQEAANPQNPLLERIKFMAIYSNNLDEYFRVRVANVRSLLRLGKKTKAQLDFDPKVVMKEIRRVVNKQQVRYTQIFRQSILPELGRNNIRILRETELNEEQHSFVDQYFNNHMLPFVQPVLLLKNKIRPFLNNASLYIITVLHDLESKSDEKHFAIIKIPSDHLPRFIVLPSAPGTHSIIRIDDIVRRYIPWLFPGFKVLASYSIKLTRDAELYIEDEFSGDLIEKIRHSLTKRNVGPASRLVFDREMDSGTLQFLKDMFDLESVDLFPEGRYHNNMDYFKFPDFGMNHLKVPPLPPIPFEPLESGEGFYQNLKEKDYLIHPPYHAFNAVVRFFEEACHDPLVTHIKLVQYRVGEESRIIQALKTAINNGKDVSVFIELKARFDEAANLKWGAELESHGARVHYSFPGLKVHSKLALVRREEMGGPCYYAYLGTGNFHEGTARIYSDMGLFTFDKRLTEEVAHVFTFLETVQLPNQNFDHLLVGQFNMVQHLRTLIDHEIMAAKRGRPAEICLKLNSIQDEGFIQHLYRASEAGVKIRLIVRGICCLIPGDPRFSSNIEAISIVDRFLEHARVFIFLNGGQHKIYLSSADWMTRNLHYRIETAFPIYDEGIKKTILDLIEIQWQDNQRSRIMDTQQTNFFRQTNEAIPIRAQYETYAYLKRKAMPPKPIAVNDEMETE